MSRVSRRTRCNSEHVLSQTFKAGVQHIAKSGHCQNDGYELSAKCRYAMNLQGSFKNNSYHSCLDSSMRLKHSDLKRPETKQKKKKKNSLEFTNHNSTIQQPTKHTTSNQTVTETNPEIHCALQRLQEPDGQRSANLLSWVILKPSEFF